MMSRVYWALNSGEHKGTIISSKHGCNSWLIMGNWLSSLNQTKVMAHIIAGEAQLVGILIPKQIRAGEEPLTGILRSKTNRAESIPPPSIDPYAIQTDSTRTIDKMNRKRTVSA
jgi:hypothetical protein